MSAHPSIPYDPARVAEVAARLDLRAPNAAALDRVARRFDAADGEPFEAVCDIATAVGKTYLAAGVIEYLADAGVRNILVVVPGSTILAKTVANFTDGHERSLTASMSTSPMVITADNFNTGRVAAALSNDDQVKLFVFTVQSLIRPKQRTSRKVRKHQEWLGTGLYQQLTDAGDLVILADEHHVYTERATAFHAAIRELDPMALIGLTATPSKADLDKVIYDYPLAQAIADRFVKTPVLVGRKDKLTGIDVQLRDGLRLLDAKQEAADAYADATGKRRVNAVMFVVADTIDNANAIYETLRKPDLLGERYDEQVLVVHSEAPDEALAQLESVEAPDSSVRVIVSVSMLKEGWDVKNIYVICSFRPSISEALTEQTLGRGLRLPWGSYTGIELLDTVEVISHERYADLLERAGVLLEGLTGQRASLPAQLQVTPAPTSGRYDADGSDVVSFAAPLGAATADGVTGGPPGASPGGDVTATDGTGPGSGAWSGSTGFLVSGVDARTATARAEAQTLTHPVTASQSISIPKLERTISQRQFSLSDIDDATFRRLGGQLAADGGTNLDRKVLRVIEDDTHPSGLRLVPATSADRVVASAPDLPFPEARERLIAFILGLDEVAQTEPNANAAVRLADAIIDGAGTESALAAQFNAIVDAIRVSIRAAYRRAPATPVDVWTSEEFAPSRLNTRPEEPNRYGSFSRQVAYSGWTRSLHALNWFDSEPERRFANLIDDESSIDVWSRIQRGELTIPWEGGRYHPDFYLRTADEQYLVEVKAENALDDPVVLAKRDAARAWARMVSDRGGHGTWSYLLVGEHAVRNSATFDALTRQAT